MRSTFSLSLSLFPSQSADYGRLLFQWNQSKSVLSATVSCPFSVKSLQPSCTPSPLIHPVPSSSEPTPHHRHSLQPITRVHKGGAPILLTASPPLLKYDDVTMGPHHQRLHTSLLWQKTQNEVPPDWTTCTNVRCS